MATLPLEDGDLWYEETGDGPPLVLVHGGWQNSDSWQEQVDQFADEYRVVTFDLRGHGRTGATDTPQYSIDLFVDDLERLLSHLDIERPILGGSSVGGMVVQSYLDRHPDGAAGAVIAGPLQSMPPVDIPAMMKPFVSPLPMLSVMVSTVGTTATFRSLLTSIRAMTGGPWLTIDSAVRSQAMDSVGDCSPKEYLKIFRALYGFVPPELSHVEIPVLVLYGAQEAPQVKRQGEQLAKTVANGSWQEIPDAGHLVNQDNPHAFNDACTAFFADLD